MSPLARATLCVVIVVGLAGCASTGSASGAGEAPPPRAAPTHPAPAPDKALAERAGTTGLTEAVVSTSDAPTSEWTDAQIVTIVVAANAADVEQAAIARERTRDPRILRFAGHLEGDDHVLGTRARELAERLGKADSPGRLEVDVERGGFLVAMRDAMPERFEAAFLRAQIEQSNSLVRLIDEQLGPAAKSPEVLALLREVRAGAMFHVSMAQAIQAGSSASHLH